VSRSQNVLRVASPFYVHVPGQHCCICKKEEKKKKEQEESNTGQLHKMLSIVPNAHFISSKPKFFIKVVFCSNVNMMAVKLLFGHAVGKIYRENKIIFKKGNLTYTHVSTIFAA
jgi:hypothetical protein